VATVHQAPWRTGQLARLPAECSVVYVQRVEQSGVDVSVVSKRLGHANMKITADRYAHVTARLQQDAAARFSAYLSTPPAENLTVRDRFVTDCDSSDVSLGEDRGSNRVRDLAPEHGFEP
jgi:hypothetical protein